MERRIRMRILSLLVLVALVVGIFSLRVYKLQAAQTEETIQAANSITYWTTIEAARGQILDRNGNVLVTNRASYNLSIINFVFFNGPNYNDRLLELLHKCDDLGITITHHLPVTETKPYAYTLDDQSSTWQDYFRQFLRYKGIDSDVSAGAFMRILRDNYGISDDLSDEDAYRMCAVRYELTLRAIDGSPLGNYMLAEDVDATSLAAVMELGIPGVIVETTTVREYKTPYASHLLGYTTKMSAEAYESVYKDLGYSMNANVGQEGVEKAFEEYLHGTDGLMQTTVTATGEILSQEYLTTPVPGGNVELSIDIGLQTVAAQALEEWVLYLRENGYKEEGDGTDATGGAVVAIDVATGEILAAASYPTYDANTFRQDYNELAEDENKPLINRCFNAQYPPGSVYKMVTAITAVDYAGVSRWREIRDEGTYTKYADQGYTPACHIYRSKGYTHGVENMMDAIRDSCNYYFYEVGLECSINDMDYVASMMGLGESTGVEVSEYSGRRANAETKAEVYAGTNLSGWVDGDMLQASIGQSVNEFTPVQLAVYCATLANEGTRMKATVLRRVVSWDFQELLVESQPEVASKIELSSEAVAAYKEGMVDATQSNGTAYLFSQAGYDFQVAAKTGTAQHGNGLTSDNASMICYAPADDPQIAIAIYVENGATGGQLANIAMAIFDSYFSQTGKYETVYDENEVR